MEDCVYTLFPSASTPFPSSSTWNLRFSSNNTVPGAGLAQAASTSGPTQSDKNVTGLKKKGRQLKHSRR